MKDLEYVLRDKPMVKERTVSFVFFCFMRTVPKSLLT